MASETSGSPIARAVCLFGGLLAMVMGAFDWGGYPAAMFVAGLWATLAATVGDAAHGT